MRTLFLAASLLLVISQAGAVEGPVYKPSSSASHGLDITSNAYGSSSLAPDALAIGEQGPLFTLPRSGGGDYALADAVAAGPVVLIFYRGHW